MSGKLLTSMPFKQVGLLEFALWIYWVNVTEIPKIAILRRIRVNVQFLQACKMAYNSAAIE